MHVKRKLLVGAEAPGGTDLPHALVTVALSAESAVCRTAQWITEHQEQAAGMSISDLAAATGVGETTVFRLCRALGFDGYRGLRLALAESRGLARGRRLAAAEPEAEGAPAAMFARIARRTVESNSEALLDTLRLVDPETLERATKQLLEARHIHLMGFGSSYPVAADAYQRFLRLGLVASVYCDPHVLAALAAAPPAGSVFFAITYSGQTRDVVETLETAGRRGCTRIVLTSNPRGRVTELAETVLLSSVRRSRVTRELIATRISQLAIIDMLCVGLALRHARKPHFVDEETLFEREIAKKRVPPPPRADDGGAAGGGGT